MKYVKTKDGRIINCEDPKWKHPATYTEQAQIYAMFDKQADNIDELVDTYIVQYKIKKRDIIRGFDTKQAALEYIELIKQKGVDDFDAYAGVWDTSMINWYDDPILKVVAISNEKGELELI